MTATATADGTLRGTETIALDQPGDVWLRLWANGPGGCAHRHITITAPVVRTTLDCTAVLVHAPDPTLRFGFRIDLPRANARLGTWRGASYYGDALPTLATVLTPPIELGDPFATATAAWTIDLTWPAGLAAAAGGASTPREAPTGMRRAVFALPAARDVALAIGPWRERTTTVAGTRIRTLGNGPTAPGAFAALTRRYGATGLAVLDVVMTPGLESEGMEYSGLVLTERSKETLVHELAHQWFSQLVGSNGYAEPWLDETLTTYAQMRQLDLLGDCDTRRPFAGYGTARLTWTLAEFNRHDDWYGAIYDGGACAFAKLADAWGPGAFDALLKEYVARYRGGMADTAGFVALLRERAPAGYDVDAFLRYARLVPA